MAQLILINSLLIGLVSATALTVMIYWHRATLGAWRAYAAGRTQMHLLAIIFFITANAAVQTIIPLPLMVKVAFYFGLYIVFAVALARVGLNIRAEVTRGRREDAMALHPSTPLTKEEAHD
jgi:cation transport ATPase